MRQVIVFSIHGALDCPRGGARPRRPEGGLSKHGLEREDEDLLAPASESAVAPELPDDEFVEYDPGFRPAIAEGFLTVHQAVERGDRMIYASRVAKRHGLATDVALLVADNRMRLADAVQAKTAGRLGPGREYVSTAWAFGGVAVAAAVIVYIGAIIWMGNGGFIGESTDRTAATLLRRPVRTPSVRAAYEVRTDVAGKLTGIRALDAESVLATYCNSVRPSDPPVPVRVGSNGPDGRLGIFNQDGALYAIPIRKDGESAYWIAGNDKDPIVPVSVEAAAAPSGAEPAVH